jgi:P4 family phage/plasmid primase-like protien
VRSVAGAWDPEVIDQAIPPLPEPLRADRNGSTDDEPPVELGPEALKVWRGEKPKVKDGQIDRSSTLVKIGRVLYDAHATRPAIVAALRERDIALGYRKYVDRTDAEDRYHEIVDELESNGRNVRARLAVGDNKAGGATLDPEDRRGLTVTLAETIKERRRFAKDAGGKLYHYEGGVYRPGGDERVAVEVKHLLAESSISAKWSTHRAKEVAEYIRVDAPKLWEQPPRDQINVRNGILDVATGSLEQHTPEFLSSAQLPVLYDPDAECPAWDKFISETFPKDAQQLAYEIPAWLATPDTSIQKAILLLGEGANGKSTYLAAAGAFIGRDNYAALSLQKIEADRFAAARLVGKLANICPDLPSVHLSSTSTFKAITGGDPIACEYKYGSSFDLRPFARLVFSANHPPRSGDASHAFYRRWLVVPFDQSFEPEEQRSRTDLDAELSDWRELSGVLNRVLVALRGIRRRGGFSESRSTRDALAEFQKTTDPLSVWLDRNTIEHPEAMVAQDELRRAFNQFAENSGKPGMTPQSFGRALARVKPGIEKAQRTWQGVSNTRVYLGIGLRADASEEQHDQRDQRNDPYRFKEEKPPISKNNTAQRVDRVEQVSAELSTLEVLQVLENPDTGAHKNALLYVAGETALEYLVRSVLFSKGVPTEAWQQYASTVEEAFEEWRRRGL